jgi:outer membrane protein assembly factor BamE (lipoprotein component of BamABCDE complex)
MIARSKATLAGWVVALSLVALAPREATALLSESAVAEEAARAMLLPEKLERWRKLRRGMRHEDVAQLLGEPPWTDAQAGVEFWMYQEPVYVAPGVVLFENGRVTGWRSPTQ